MRRASLYDTGSIYKNQLSFSPQAINNLKIKLRKFTNTIKKNKIREGKGGLMVTEGDLTLGGEHNTMYR